MNKPITLCDRCKEYARCCLIYDGYNCQKIRTIEPTNADKIRAMTDEELAKYLAWLEDEQACYECELYGDVNRITEWLNWLKEEVK